MKHKILAFLLIVTLAVTGFAVTSPLAAGPAPALAQTEPTVLMRVVHTIPGAGPVDVYVDGDLVAPGLDFTDATPHIAFAGGEHTVAVRAGGAAATDPAVFEDTITLTPTSDGYRHATLVIQSGTEGAPQFALYADDLNPADLGFARIHVIHAVPDAGPVDVLGTNRAQIAQGVDFNTPGGSVNAPVNSYELVVTPSGGEVEDAILEIGTLEVNTNFLYTIIIAGSGSDLTPIVLQRAVFPASDRDEILTAVAHGSVDAPALDIYANDVLAFVNLEPGEVVSHVPLPLGDITFALREAGTPANSEPAFETTVNISSATGAATLTALGTLADGAFSLSIRADAITGLNSEEARIVVLNTVPTGPATLELDDSTVLTEGLSAFSTAPAVDVPAGTYTVTGTVDDETGPVSLELDEQTFVGGTYYTLLVFLDDEAQLSSTATALNVQPNSLPGATAGEDVAVVVEETPVDDSQTTDPTPEPTVEPTAVPDEDPTPEPTVQPTAEPTSPPPPPTAGPSNALVGVVNLDSGVNLHCREYPTSQAFSLGLIPNSTEIVINGYAGPIDEEDGEPLTPLEEGAFDDPQSAEEFEEIWVEVAWDTTEGPIECWVRADFLLMSYRNRRIIEVEDFFALEELELFPPVLEMIPSNYPGGPQEEGVTISPPTPQRDDPVGTVNLDAGVSLHLRRQPNIEAESLALLPNGTTVFVLERTEAEVSTDIGAPDSPTWLYVEYITEQGTTTGWISAQYMSLSQRGRQIDIEDIPEAEEIRQGERNVDSDSAPPPSSNTGSASTSSDAYLGTLINLNAGANLNLRDDTTTDARVVASIPAGSQVTVLGRNGDGEWLNVRYEIAGEGTFEGWVTTQFVEVTRNGQLVDVQELPITSGETDTMEQQTAG